MQIYHYQVYFSNGFDCAYSVTASNEIMAMDELLEEARANAAENDCQVIRYILTAIEKNISKNS